jgi:hypothetical protein
MTRDITDVATMTETTVGLRRLLASACHSRKYGRFEDPWFSLVLTRPLGLFGY